MRWTSFALVLLFASACGSSVAGRTATTSTSARTSTTPSSALPTSSTAAPTTSTISSSTTSKPASTPPLGTGGVRGRVTAGPTCPVEREDQPCPPRPVTSTHIDALAGGHVAGSAITDDDGRYAITLDPGDYTLRVATGGAFPRCPDTDVHVRSGPPVTVDIDCDTGIR